MNTIIQALKQAGKQVKGKMCQCPWHDDSNPSASILQADDGRYKVYCHVCKRWGDEHDILGTEYGEKKVQTYKTLEDLVRPIRNITAIHKYHKDKELKFAVIRQEQDGKKKFIQATRNGVWSMKSPPKPSVLYNYDGIKDKSTVVVVEGEKAADALIKYGFPATTSAGGSSNAKGGDWSVLNGKNVILWPDNDDVGRRYMQEVESMIDAKTKWCEPDLPEKGDAYDFVKNAEEVNRTLGEGDGKLVKQIIRDQLGDARGKSGVDGLRSHIQGCIDGDNLPVEFVHEILDGATQALLPGTVTLVCGDPCSGKSFLVMDWMINWAENGVKVASFFLEDGKDEFHLPRALAMKSGVTGVLNRKWINQNPEPVKQALDEHSELLDVLDKQIDDAPNRQESMESMKRWMETKAKTNRVLIVDPVTVLSEGKKQKWVADTEFILAAKDIARTNKCSIIFVTHPKTGTKGEYSLEALAGGAAYPRFSHTVLWLEHHDKKTVDILNKTCMGSFPEEQEINKTLHIMKARNADGTGAKLGMLFKDLRFEEAGIIVKKEKN